MAHLSDHEYLVNVVAFLSSNVVSRPGCVISSAGVLLSSCNYEMKFSELEGFQTLLKEQKVPDLCVVNADLGTVLVIECKSGIEEEKQQFRLEDQIKFFLSNAFLDAVKSIYKSRNAELVIVTYQGREDKIVQLVQSNYPDKNIIVWTITHERKERAILKKVLGTHADPKLDRLLEEPGVEFDPPVSEMLIDPTLSDRVLTCRILVRLLTWHITAELVRETEDHTVTVDKFKEEHKDCVQSNKKLKDVFRYLSILVPELGKFENDTGGYTLSSRPNLPAVIAKEKLLQDMSDEEFQMKLYAESMPEVRPRIKPLRLRPGRDQTRLPRFLTKGKA